MEIDYQVLYSALAVAFLGAMLVPIAILRTVSYMLGIIKRPIS